jgi:uncharacterized protein YmfQ (DUF2313 family)
MPDFERDKHIRRAGSDYAQAYLDLLPLGQAWPREDDSTLVKVVNGLCEYWGYVDSRQADILEIESDPRKTVALLPEWERAWGLPDPCFPTVTTIGERQRMLVLYMTWMGGQSRDYFTRLMAWLGFEIKIGEYAPFMAGMSQVGDTRPSPTEQFRWYIGPPEQRFYWFARVGQVGLVWFRAGSGQAGVDHHLEFKIPQELQCLLNRWKPAHTGLVMDFSALAFGGPMQGTP